MALEKDECQKIVNRLMNILGKNINIMDDNGVIIASGDKSRINTLHEGAKLAASENKEVIIDESNVELFHGCRRGVNIPLFYNGKVQGVVGITGAEQEVKGHGIIVKELVELMIYESERKKEELFQSRAIKNFAKELIKEHEEEDVIALRNRANLIGFKENIKRVVIVGDVCDFIALLRDYGEEAEVKAQILKQDIVNFITEHTNCREDIAINLFEDRFIILKSYDRDILDYCQSLHDNMKCTMGVTMKMALGTECYDIKDYSKSYNLASDILELGRKLNPNENLFKKEDYSIEFLINSVPKEKMNECANIFKNEISSMPWGDYEELIETAGALLECSMNIKTASDKLFVHRNTLLYRIKKYREYNIDIMNVYLCMKLHIYNTIQKLQS